MVGAVFVSEGIQKFLFPGEVGAGRFTKIGIPNPDSLAGFVGGVEILCGLFILLGLVIRMACIPLMIIMFIAIVTTKFDVLSEEGVWKMLHESRTDWSMLLGNVFLLIKGSGKWSLDWLLLEHDKQSVIP